ncbi:site-specific integrase [Bacillus cereus group sp. BfR-BA-01349]|uniref:tyrosine-type recombinase/integrase n=1 Tax=Bacillus cereus group sp. BfR-BA-01349 TaxID=2920312 RepID=UPI001F55AB54
MGYIKLNQLINVLDDNDRLLGFIEYYKHLDIDGMHYVEFNSKENIIHISTPDHDIHKETTCFLIKLKYYNVPINTVNRSAHDLKKFLDFLMFWKINLLEIDLFVIIVSFVSYLRVLKNQRANKASIQWAIIDKVPLHQKALNFKKLSSIRYNNEGFMENELFEDFKIHTIQSSIYTVLAYLEFLRDFTYKYKGLQIDVLPTKLSRASNILTGTLKTKKEYVTYDVNSIMQEAGINVNRFSIERIKPLSEEIFSLHEINLFMNSIPENDKVAKLMFNILMFFGLRRAEACNLMINSRNIPQDLYLWDVNVAKKWLKENLRGDIEYDIKLKKWVCHIIRREASNFQSQHKSINRRIPLMFSQEDFCSVLLEHIILRQITLNETRHKHDFLFFSTSNNSKGKPITGGTIYSKYNSIKKNSGHEEFFSKYSPHTFRHFFATYLIRYKKISIYDVSVWLGHRNEKTTKKVYLHYLPQENDDDISIVEDMVDVFRKN